MAWSFCRDPETFLQKRRAYLSANESLNCLCWAAIQRSKDAPPDKTSHTFLTFMDGPTTTAHAFIQHSRQNIVLSPMAEAQAEQLVDALGDRGVPLRVAEGPRGAALRFSGRWSEATGQAHEHLMDQGLYELRSVDMPDAAGGRLVRAEDQHRDILHALVEGFVACFPEQPMAPAMIDERVVRFLREERVFLWQQSDQAFVSMAAVVRESPEASSISWVYTPPEHRRRGHAARVVASLSQAQLDAGKVACNLHTDLANPTSNGIYTRIGYRKIAESIRIRLRSDHTQM